jgi:3-oxoacyl-[acyl-carrier protein] reductase
MDDKNKTAFITGGSSGIGLETAHLLLEKGYAVAIYSNVIPKTTEVQFIASHRHGLVIKGDITDKKAVRAAVAQAQRRFKSIDILINNAAVAQNKPFADTTPKDWDFIIDTNIKGTLAVTHETLKVMRKQGSGMVINISSGAGTYGIRDLSIYSLTKAALINFTQSLSQEVADYGIEVLTITPGSTDTGMFKQLFPDDAAHHSPADVAAVILRAIEKDIAPDDRLIIDTFFHER